MRYLILVLIMEMAEANSPPSAFTYQGRIFKSNGVDPVNGASVSFTLQILSPDGTCLLFQESHLRNMTSSLGHFSLNVGQGTNANVSALSLVQSFENSTSKTGSGGCVYNPVSNDSRRLRFSYNDGVESVTLPSDQMTFSVPFSWTAQNVEGLTKSNILQVSTQSTQVKLDTVLTGYSALIDLIAGNSNLYSKSSDLPLVAGVLDLSTGGVLVSNTPSSGQSAVNQNYTDVNLGGETLNLTGLTNGQVLTWNQALSQWQPSSLTVGTVTSVTASAPLSVANGTSAPVISLQPGVTAGEVLRWSGTVWERNNVRASELKSAAGLLQLPTSTCTVSKTLVYVTPTDTYSCSDIAIASTQVSGLGGSAILNVGTLAGTVAAGNDSRITGAIQPSQSIAGDLSGTYASPIVEKIRSVNVSATAPTNGQVLKYNLAQTRWEPSTDNSNVGTVTSVFAGTGLTGGSITGSGTLAVDVGTTASKIVQLDSTARLPAVDGSQLTGLSIPFSQLHVINTSGPSTWTVPAGVTKIFVQVWGAGGGGAGGTALNIAGSGGAAGGYASGFVTVVPLSVISVSVGAGGSGGSAGSNGVAGGQSYFSTNLVANGGARGLATSSIPTIGGTTSGTQSAITINGGNGGAASLYVLSTGSLGGFGGTAGGGGGAGGGGSASSGSAGSEGTQPGGGGGGGGSVVLSASAGGAGGTGRIIIWY